MRFFPIAPADQEHMLKTIGAGSIDDLFSCIPPEIRFTGKLALERALSEQELQAVFCELAAANSGAMMTSFLGAGSYGHFIPSHIDQLLLRSEFYTAYTPYQPEVAQGTLQTIFEFQTMIAMLAGMEVANASLYDGATACSEALLMADRVVRGRNKVVISGALHPHYRQVCDTYLSHLDLHIETAALGADGRTDCGGLERMLDESTSAVLVQSPNFFGCIEDVAKLAEAVHSVGAMLIVAVAEPLSLGLVRAPGGLGADIVCGDAQSFGVPRQFGGPGLGFFAARSRHVRQMPGRLVGRARDVDGRDGFVLALSTREQHIRRDKATSNICTNQGLCMTAATIYMATLGKAGLRELALLNLSKAAYLKDRLTAIEGVEVRYGAPHFNELTLRLPRPAAQVLMALEEKGILGGLDLGRFDESRENELLVCATELTAAEAVDRLAAEMEAVL